MTIQEIKAISISGFLSSKGYEPANKKGYKWWYLSPLHTEQTASFKVDLNKNVWYDFGLGKGGNIIDLAMELYHTQNVSEVIFMSNNMDLGYEMFCYQCAQTANGKGCPGQ